jgi:hypothetical protein
MRFFKKPQPVEKAVEPTYTKESVEYLQELENIFRKKVKLALDGTKVVVKHSVAIAFHKACQEMMQELK